MDPISGYEIFETRGRIGVFVSGVKTLLFDVDQTYQQRGPAYAPRSPHVFSFPLDSECHEDISPRMENGSAIARETCVRLKQTAAEIGQIDSILDVYLSYLKKKSDFRHITRTGVLRRASVSCRRIDSSLESSLKRPREHAVMCESRTSFF